MTTKVPTASWATCSVVATMRARSACRPAVSWAWLRPWTARLRGSTSCWLQPLTQVRPQWRFGAAKAADSILKCLKDDLMLALQDYISVYSVPKSVVYVWTHIKFNLLNLIIHNMANLVRGTVFYVLTQTLLECQQTTFWFHCVHSALFVWHKNLNIGSF